MVALAPTDITCNIGAQGAVRNEQGVEQRQVVVIEDIQGSRGADARGGQDIEFAILNHMAP